jgi:fumarylacetoacetate (FAA) hydrolase
MKLVTFRAPGDPVTFYRSGWLDRDYVIDAHRVHQWLVYQKRRVPTPAQYVVGLGRGDREQLRALLGADRPDGVAFLLSEAELLAAVPQPRTIRDFYAFEAHVKNARARRGLAMQPEWYQFPVFYFSNPNAVYGPGAEVPKPRNTQMLDFELEVACVIGQEGRDIRPEDAADHIAGYMIMNDWSARDIQREEMKVGLGPAKGKDFATSFGPWLVTPDELEDRREGNRHRLEMVARINGREVSRGNLADIHFSFAELIARASQDCTLYPGEVIGSGTVGTGCLLETEAAPWLQSGDVVKLEVERLGVLTNKVR